MVFAVDTNILVRIFIDDDKALVQVKAARALAASASKMYVTQLVQAELTWVLQSTYKLKKSAIEAILKQLLTHSIFKLEKSEVFAEALAMYQQGNIGFADCLILTESNQAKVPLYTFDKKLIQMGAKKV